MQRIFTRVPHSVSGCEVPHTHALQASADITFSSPALLLIQLCQNAFNYRDTSSITAAAIIRRNLFARAVYYASLFSHKRNASCRELICWTEMKAKHAVGRFCKQEQHERKGFEVHLLNKQTTLYRNTHSQAQRFSFFYHLIYTSALSRSPL